MIIILKPYALNVEFQHFIPKFNKKNHFMDRLKEGFDGEKEAQIQGDFMNNFSISTYIYTEFTCHIYYGY